MLVQRRRWWANIKRAFNQRLHELVFAGKIYIIYVHTAYYICTYCLEMLPSGLACYKFTHCVFMLFNT